MSTPRLSYIVASVPRSGSSLLCELLGRTGIAGSPGEYFSPYTFRVWREGRGGGTLDEYLRELIETKTGPGGVFGAKAHWAQYRDTLGDTDPAGVIPGVRIVYITRRDRLRQAVSWARAQQTGKFHADDPEHPERRPEFDREHIARMVNRIGHEEALWERFFERHGVVPHRVVYEDLVADQEAVVRGVLGFLGLDAPADLHLPAPALARQADALSDEWVERYLAEAATSPGPAPGAA